MNRSSTKLFEAPRFRWWGTSTDTFPALGPAGGGDGRADWSGSGLGSTGGAQQLDITWPWTDQQDSTNCRSLSKIHFSRNKWNDVRVWKLLSYHEICSHNCPVLNIFLDSWGILEASGLSLSPAKATIVEFHGNSGDFWRCYRWCMWTMWTSTCASALLKPSTFPSYKSWRNCMFDVWQGHLCVELLSLEF